MAGIRDQEQIDALRKRLYDRAQNSDFTSRHQLTDTPVDVARGWGGAPTRPTSPPRVSPPPVRPPTPEPTPPVYEATVTATPEPVIVEESESGGSLFRGRSYRTYILAISMAIFVIAVGVSSIYLFFGANQISGKNISVELQGPAIVGGGDVISLQIGVNNSNSVPIQSATLIINYPSGTQSTESPPRDLFQERISLDTLAPGEVKNTAKEIVVFGEENEEKVISATVEYRVAGSNGTFYKEASPLTFRINSSPVVLRIESLEKVAAGQEIEVKVIVQSNALTPRANVLLSAEYPGNFSFTSADPAPDYGQNGWLISELGAQAAIPFTIRGVVDGLENEEFQMRFLAGSPRSDNQYVMGSRLAMANTNFLVERPFIGTSISVNGDSSGRAVLAINTATQVQISVTNTHSEPIYDMSVRVTPRGNVFREENLSVRDGFYNSIDKYVAWEVSGRSDLGTVLPGTTREFSFTIQPDSNQSTASFEIEASVFGRRVNEDRVTEELIGNSTAEVRYSSTVSLGRQVAYGTEGFVDTGPVPPQADQETTYTITLLAQAGVNDITGTVVTAQLPQYVRWINRTAGEGGVEYNPVSGQLRWTIGDMSGRSERALRVQVGITPSVLQVGSTPVIIGAQDMRATDRFAGVALRATAPPLTTELSTETGFPEGNGAVVPRGGVPQEDND